jgi:hypothetical protein
MKMGLYVRDALAAEVASSIAAEYDLDDFSVDEGLQNFAYSVSRQAIIGVLPTEEQITECSKQAISMVLLSGSNADPESPEYVEAVADLITETLFPYFKPLEQDQTKGFELPDV